MGWDGVGWGGMDWDEVGRIGMWWDELGCGGMKKKRGESSRGNLSPLTSHLLPLSYLSPLTFEFPLTSYL